MSKFKSKPGRKRSRLIKLTIPFVVVVLLLVCFSEFRGNRSSAEIGNMPTESAAPLAAYEESSAGVVTEKARPGESGHDEMYFLRFRYSKGTVSLSEGRRVRGGVKPQRSLRGKTGIYFCARTVEGKTLADGIIEDPLKVRYAFGDVNGEPEGGVIWLEEADLVVRLPVLAGSAFVELYTVSPAEADASQFALPKNSLGSFPLSNVL